jgi:hypothetical protein
MVLSMVKPKRIHELCQKCFYSGLHMILEFQGYQSFLGASQCLTLKARANKQWK